MSAKKAKSAGRIVNRRAKFDYELGDSLVVGIALTGAETKSLRMGHGNLQGAYVTLKADELWLINAQIQGFTGVNIEEQDQTRSRKLLAKKREIAQLIEDKTRGNAIVPLEILTGGRFIKIRIAAGRGKKRYDKRETIKRRQQERDIARQQR